MQVEERGERFSKEVLKVNVHHNFLGYIVFILAAVFLVVSFLNTTFASADDDNGCFNCSSCVYSNESQVEISFGITADELEAEGFSPGYVEFVRNNIEGKNITLNYTSHYADSATSWMLSFPDYSYVMVQYLCSLGKWNIDVAIVPENGGFGPNRDSGDYANIPAGYCNGTEAVVNTTYAQNLVRGGEGVRVVTNTPTKIKVITKPISQTRIDNLVLGPDPFKIYNPSKDWVKYSDVFNKDITCSFSVYNSDPDEDLIVTTFMAATTSDVYNGRVWPGGIYNISHHKSGDRVELTVPQKYVYPSDTFSCNVTINSVDGSFASAVSNNVTMPTFDLYIDRNDVFNAVNGTPLVNGKDYIVRIWPRFTSNLIDILDVPIKVGYVDQTSFSSDKEVTDIYNYPSIDWLKSHVAGKLPKNAVTPLGTNNIDILRGIKEGNESVNIRGNSISILNYHFNFYINSTGVKEDDLSNNEVSSSVPSKKQVRNFKVLFVVLYNSGTEYTAQIEDPKSQLRNDVEDFVNQSYEFFMQTYPFSKQRTTNFDVSNIVYKKVKYDGNLMRYYSDKEFVAGLSYAEKKRKSEYGLATQKKITNEINKLRIEEKADVAVVFSVDKEFMHNREMKGYSRYYNPLELPNDKLSYVYINYDTATKDRTALAHEMGHNIADLPNEYNNSIDKIGFASEGDGWLIDDSLPIANVGKARINIWNEPNYLTKSGQTQTFDVLESSLDSQYDTTLRLGPRYYNIMGVSEYSGVWISTESSNRILAKLILRGIIS